jgi:hypothetical protein
VEDPLESTIRPVSDTTPQISNIDPNLSFQSASAEVDIPPTDDDNDFSFITCTGELLPC